MKKITIWMSVAAVAASAILPAQGGTYTWLATPADGNWNTSSLNWSDDQVRVHWFAPHRQQLDVHGE